jgi:phosphatidylserine decarboxylase
MYIHKEGKMYVIVATIIFATILCLIHFTISQYPIIYVPLIAIFGFLWFWVFWFFRIPTRQEVSGDSLVMSPCDGKVVVIEEAVETEFFKDKRIQVSIFMSPLNVHVNKYPISGKVDYVKYHAGKFLVAWHPKSSTENERSTVVVSNGKASILFRQIAGAVARRIVTYAKAGDAATQNAEFGFIKFGSRVDLFLPIGTTINVKIDDIVQGGISTIATI